MTRATARERLGSVLSLYNLAGYVAAALGAALVSQVESPRILFSRFLAGALVQVSAYALMRADTGPAVSHHRATVRAPSRPLVRRLAGLFAIDSLAGGFVVQSLITYWFHAATLTNTARAIAQSLSPTLTGWVMQALSLSAPFVLGGGLKVVYDVLLYVTIRHVRTR